MPAIQRVVTAKQVAQAFDTYTAKVSEGVRTYAFAVLALVWIVVDRKLDRFTQPLLWAAVAVIFTFVLDLAQYVYMALRYSRLKTDAENHGKSGEQTVDLPRGILSVGSSLFWLKLLVLAFATAASLYGTFHAAHAPPDEAAVTCVR